MAFSPAWHGPGRVGEEGVSGRLWLPYRDYPVTLAISCAGSRSKVFLVLSKVDALLADSGASSFGLVFRRAGGRAPSLTGLSGRAALTAARFQNALTNRPDLAFMIMLCPVSSCLLSWYQQLSHVGGCARSPMHYGQNLVHLLLALHAVRVYEYSTAATQRVKSVAGRLCKLRTRL